VTTTESESAFALQVLDACVAHGRQLLASQLPALESQKLDLMPSLRDVATQLYLAGAMWRFGERFDLPSAARDRGFICLMSMLISDGMNADKAQKRVAELNRLSRSSEGHDLPAIVSGYAAQFGDGSLATLFVTFLADPKAAGAPYRLLDYSKPVAAILTAAGFGIALLLGRSFGEACGVGLVLGISTLGCALAIYWRMVKVKM